MNSTSLTAIKRRTNASAKPALSVLLCNYNHGRYLERCLGGLLRQTMKDFEVVIVDDGSTDQSRSILRAVARQDRRLKPVYFERNQGLMVAAANVWKRAEGDLIFGHGADDFLVDEDFFGRSVEALEQYPQAAGCYGVAGLFDDGTNQVTQAIGSAPSEGFIPPPLFRRGFLSGEVFVPGSSSIWRRELMQEFDGFDPELGPQVDLFLNHLLPSRQGVVFQNKVVSCQRIYASNKNYGSKFDLWDSARRFARVEQRMREIVPAFNEPGLDRGWRWWRSRWMVDCISKTGFAVTLHGESNQAA